MAAVRRAGCAMLAVLVCLLACGCGKAETPDVAALFSRQSALACTVESSCTFSVVIDGEETTLQVTHTLEGDVDFSADTACIYGETETLWDGESAGAVETECYTETCDLTGDAVAWCRYGTLYYTQPIAATFLTTILTPQGLSLSDYTALSDAQTLSGTVCDVYVGDEIADDSEQLYYNGSTQGSVCLAGCVVQMTVYVSHTSGLPIRTVAEYTNLDDLQPAFTDESGNTYTLTELTTCVTYSAYGVSCPATVPEDFRSEAEREDGAPTSPSASSESIAVRADDEAFVLYNTDDASGFAITSPTHMSLWEQGGNSVSFTYFYAQDDYETIEYTLCANTSSDEMETTARARAASYAALSGVSDVSSDDVQTLTVGTLTVSYHVIYLTVQQDETTLSVVDICSWVSAPNGTDCLQVFVSEYNAAESAALIDPVEELQYAYSFVDTLSASKE